MSIIKTCMIAVLPVFLLSQCTIKQPNTDKITKDDTLSYEIKPSVDNEIQNIEIEKIEITPGSIINKTFYYIRQTDSGNVVVDWYQRGFDGIKYTENKIKAFGFEDYVLNIDSIQSTPDSLLLFLSNEYTNLFGEKEKDSHVDRVELINGKLGYILVNGEGVLIDSTYAGKTIPIVNEEPYDIKKAIGDF